nr:pre-mRNA splicing Prp18-interacting factor [Tanacetum cinerariifolium]
MIHRVFHNNILVVKIAGLLMKLTIVRLILMSTFVLCVGCGTPLYGLLPCQWCTCERCGNDLRDGFCSLYNSRNSCVYDPNPNSLDCPPDSSHPLHPTYETYSYNSYGNDSHFGYNFQPQFPLNYESEPGYIENYTSYPYDSSSFPQQYPCCEDCRVTHEAYHCQPPQYTIDHPFFNAHNNFLDSQKELNIAQNKIMKQMTSLTSMYPACCDDDDDYNSAITPTEPVDSLSMGDDHLNTISATKSDEFIKSCVENLVPNPRESEGKNGCDVHACFTTLSNVLFDAEYEFDSVDDQSCSDEDVPEKIFLNPLFEGEINSMRIDQHHFNVESDLIESLLNRDSSIFLLLQKLIFFSMGSPDSDSFMEEIDLTFTPNDPMPPSIEDDDDDSEGDNLFLDRLLHNDPIPLRTLLTSHMTLESFFPSSPIR